MAWDLETATTAALASGLVEEITEAFVADNSNTRRIIVPFDALERACEHNLDEEGKINDLITAIAADKVWSAQISWISGVVEFYGA